jgi:phage-related baseplate assembly protein
MNLLSLSTGDFLDHLGALLNTNRLGSAYATTSLTFTLGEALTWQVVIPQGTRATPDGEVYFATDMEAIIPAGDMSVSVPATCVEAGAKHNGLLTGQINTLVDRVPYVATVQNSIITLGGTDIEGDNRLRSRIQLAPERLSTCGPENAYRYWAMSVSPDILDVAVWSPEPGQIRVAPLIAGGELPGSEILSKILAAISTKDRRPLTDERECHITGGNELLHYRHILDPHFLCLSQWIHPGPDRWCPGQFSDLAKIKAGPGCIAQRADLPDPGH